MDVPVALGIAVTFVASTGATFDPGGVFGHEVYFDSLTMFVAFLLGGALARAARAPARGAGAGERRWTACRSGRRGCSTMAAARQVSVLRLAPGDRVRVALGQAFPADGALLDGRTQVDEALLTGESTPVPKRRATRWWPAASTWARR